MEHKFTAIECEGLKIAASVETSDREAHPIYYPGNVLFVMDKGEFCAIIDEKEYTFKKNEFVLVKKYTSGTCHKVWTEEEGGAVMYLFLFHDEFIREVIHDFNFPKNKLEETKNVYTIKQNHILRGLFDSLITYINGDEKLDKDLLRLKTKEALLGICKHNPEYLSIFSEFAEPARADLEQFMTFNIPYNVPLKELARLSGRSLSTFNREFRRLFNEAPHKWLMRKRLEMAKEMLLESTRKSSQVYLEVGFKDLAHFSRSFKKQFGVSPTALKKLS